MARQDIVVVVIIGICLGISLEEVEAKVVSVVSVGFGVGIANGDIWGQIIVVNCPAGLMVVGLNQGEEREKGERMQPLNVHFERKNDSRENCE